MICWFNLSLPQTNLMFFTGAISYVTNANQVAYRIKIAKFSTRVLSFHDKCTKFIWQAANPFLDQQLPFCRVLPHPPPFTMDTKSLPDNEVTSFKKETNTFPNIYYHVPENSTRTTRLYYHITWPGQWIRYRNQNSTQSEFVEKGPWCCTICQQTTNYQATATAFSNGKQPESQASP